MTVDQVRSTHSWLQPKAPSSYPGAGLLNRGAFPNLRAPNDSLSPRLLIAVSNDGARLWRQRSPGTSGYHVLKAVSARSLRENNTNSGENILGGPNRIAGDARPFCKCEHQINFFCSPCPHSSGKLPNQPIRK